MKLETALTKIDYELERYELIGQEQRKAFNGGDIKRYTECLQEKETILNKINECLKKHNMRIAFTK